MAALVAGQLAALFGLLLFGGVLGPMLVAFMGAAAGCFVVAEPRRAAETLEVTRPEQPRGPAPRARSPLAPYPRLPRPAAARRDAVAALAAQASRHSNSF